MIHQYSGNATELAQFLSRTVDIRLEVRNISALLVEGIALI